MGSRLDTNNDISTINLGGDCKFNQPIRLPPIHEIFKLAAATPPVQPRRQSISEQFFTKPNYNNNRFNFNLTYPNLNVKSEPLSPISESSPSNLPLILKQNRSYSVVDASLTYNIPHNPADGFGPKARYRCEICHSSFSRRNSLKRHSYTHNTFRPYNCDYCAKSFYRIDIYRRHRNSKRCRKNVESLTVVNSQL